MTVQFVPGTYSTTEGGQVAMMLQLIGAVNRAVTVTFDTTDGTATGKYSGILLYSCHHWGMNFCPLSGAQLACN